MKTNLHYVFFISVFLLTFSVFSQQKYWTETNSKEQKQNASFKNLDESNYKTFQLDNIAFKKQLIGAPIRGQINGKSNTIVSFPDEYGEIENFRIIETPVLSQELSLRYPNIKTYLGFSIDNPGTRIRFSVTPLGVNAMITYTYRKANFLSPASKNSNNEYIVYNREAKLNATKSFECLTEQISIPKQKIGLFSRPANDQILRTFRIAISTTGEYTNFWDDGNAGNGDAQEDALAQVVSTLNRSNEVFEVDMAVTFTLVTGTEIIFPDAAIDPYTSSLNSELQSTLTSVVTEANYDIGHLFTFGISDGNAGCIGCVCVDGQKGSAFSSHSFTDNDGGPYMTDFFDIDYVPHELGHQMGANHTWSFTSEGTGVNTEPGSGTTIMGFAGITGANDVQDHSDPYFHFHNIDQILDNLDARTCWTSTAITNNPPVVNAGNDYTIPQGTAFILKGASTDIDGGDTHTYTWEQIDNGVTTNTNFGPTKLTGATWRSRPPNTSPNRYMPILSRVISGQLTETNPLESVDNSTWETVSTIARDLNFALTVRDRSESNGVGQMPQSSFDTMTVTVDDSSGPFMVTSQTTNETWGIGSTQTITWDVANTNLAPVNTSNVNILLSIDGGLTFPFTLASDVPNDGSHDVMAPIGIGTVQARIIVEGAGNIFYAVNNSNFTILLSILPVNNFSLLINSETCRNSDNGNLTITAVEPLNYIVQIIGNGLDETNTFTSSTSFNDLAAGIYTVCITIQSQADYEQCFTVVITEPEDLSVLSRTNTTTGRLNLELSGGINYTIDLNGIITNTTETEISLELAPGLNRLIIKTDEDCQGIYRQTINNSLQIIVFPNPIVNGNDLNIFTGDTSIKTIEMTLYSILGKALLSQSVSLNNGAASLNISNISTGMYLLVVNTGKEQSTFKVLKK